MRNLMLLLVALATLLAACNPGKPTTTPAATPGPSVTPTRPAQEPTATPLPTLDLPDDWQPSFPVEASAQGAVSRAAGGEVRLANGARIQIPAGALPRDVTVTARKLNLSQYGPGDILDMYDVQAGGMILEQPATLVLPYGELPPGVKPADLRVFRNSPQDGVQELEAELDETSSTISVQTDRFSYFGVSASPGAWAEWGNVMTDVTRGRILPVPYYSQALTMMCYAAASQMMLKYYGVDIEAWDVARYFGLTLDSGPSMWRLWAGHYSKLFEMYGARVGMKGVDTSLWISPAINGYIIKQIDAGRPVFVTFPMGLAWHAVVVVGYDSTGVNIHDPSGSAVKGAPKERLPAVKLSWDEWGQVLFAWTNLTLSLPVPVWTIVLDGAPQPPQPPASLVLESANVFDASVNSPNLAISRPETAGLPSEFRFVWDGTDPVGYSFVPQKDLNPPIMSNSDEVTTLKVTLNNAANSPASVRLRASVDSNPIWEKEFSLAARSSNRYEELFSRGEPYRFTQSAGGSLKPGVHKLGLDLLDGTRLLDTLTVELLIAPAKPGKPEGTLQGKQVQLRWPANPERSLGVQLVYDVYRDGAQDPLASTTETSLSVPAGSGEHTYRIVARDKERGVMGLIESPPSEPVTIREDAPAATKLPGRIYLGASPFGQEDKLNHGLYVITPNADQKWRLISPRAINGVAISPDGAKLAVGMLAETGAGPGDPQLAIFDAKDPGFKLLRSLFEVRPGKGPEQLTGPSWAGDSTMLALEKVGDIHLYRYAQDKAQDKATFWAVWEGNSPAWSPTDNRLVVAGKSGDGLYLLDDATKGAYGFDPKYEIWAKEASQGFRDLRQGAVKKIEGSPDGARQPKWSPNGKNIAFTLKGVVQVMPATGGDANALTPADWKGAAPVYSPDGAYIAFARLEAEPNGGIWVIKADGTDPRQVVRANLANIFRIDLAWGP